MRITARGLYKPGDTPYRLYEATYPDGSTFAAGAMSKTAFRRDAERYGQEVVSIRCLEEKDIGDGWKEGRL